MRTHSNYDNLFVKCICRDHTNFILLRPHNLELQRKYTISVYIKSGFMGHLNEAPKFGLMRQIGVELEFSNACVLLGDEVVK